MSTKQCIKCNRVLPIEHVHKSKHQKDGHRVYCKDCVSEYGKKRRRTPEGIYEAIKGRQKYCHKYYPSKAKSFTITQENFVEWYNQQDKICVYCDIPEE